MHPILWMNQSECTKNTTNLNRPAYRFFHLSQLPPYICHQQRATISTNGILQAVGQFGLSEWNMVSSWICQRDDHLLQEGQGLVDVHGLLLGFSLRLKHRKDSPGFIGHADAEQRSTKSSCPASLSYQVITQQKLKGGGLYLSSIEPHHQF